MQKALLFIITAFLFSCKNTTNKNTTVSLKDTTAQAVSTIDAQANGQPQQTNEDLKDSIRFAHVLQDALAYANSHKSENSFKYTEEVTTEDSGFNCVTSMAFGNLFVPGKKHLLVRRIVSWGAFCDVFVLENDNFKNLNPQSEFCYGYIGDTLNDINGDGYKDFLVHWYPGSGCCRRNVYNVFLYLPQTGNLTTSYEFINPTFSPKEKTIRGVGYGHPGTVGLYKYQWNGLQVDTIEFIYPYVNHKGKFIKTKDWASEPGPENGILLPALPAEYKNIESIDWFLEY